MMDESEIRQNIKTIRERRGFTQEQMADALHIARGTYSNLEKGKVRIISDNVRALAPLLGVTLEELLLGFEPDRDASVHLREAAEDYDARYRAMQKEYEGKLADRSAEAADLRELIGSLKTTIRSQDEIIAMLKRRISEKDASEN